MGSNAFSGAVALVTGAAGGIGAAVTRRLSEAGADVAAVDVSKQGLHDLEHGATSEHGSVTGFVADLGDSAAVEAVVDDAERTLGPLSFLVNCAGVLRATEALSLSEEDWEQTFTVNVGGVFRVSTAVARRMVDRGRGSIVTVTSNAGQVPRMHMSAYGASKAAAGAFTKTLGLELAGRGVRCNVVAPGSTDTAMLRSLWKDGSGPSGTLQGDPEAYRVGIPLGRLAQPQNIADAVEFLLSDKASHITMHEMCVDGGAALGC
ncbi:2,3-dihydro-2,3-dihydroxybenzoate dehydrogenase [Streptomyces albidus (ex Kaewkla and Franco 2022)]|uniref:2,3-dihydro-2,3-dihydroxybenzoate dehydrogenase n=1 Tax=Streptomyces albidus (ex Kaewkla and Franco 2022) TaxID=722709 RepID=UPI0015EEDB2A|nr:2,3-dihydro-2,3-dihydroxybenzoate dehydrogenase [Streptomyces albidus (ex Kaewkla and Franco 2022)]